MWTELKMIQVPDQKPTGSIPVEMIWSEGFVNKANKTTRNEIERLIAGEAIEKQIRLDLTYDEIDNSIDNLWSVLFTTGYLTQIGLTEEGAYKLVIPNKEVREVYKLQIQEWFEKSLFFKC